MVSLALTAVDRCDNAASVTYDPAAEPSPHCEAVLPDGTCCPGIAIGGGRVSRDIASLSGPAIGP